MYSAISRASRRTSRPRVSLGLPVGIEQPAPPMPHSCSFQVLADGTTSMPAALAAVLFTAMFDTAMLWVPLVTCGGRFSEATGRYEDNVVVYAVPRG